nr:hypothetical protein [Mycobacterium sp. E3298]
MLFIIGAERAGFLAQSEIVVQRIDVEQGIYHLPKVAKGYYDNAIKDIVQYIAQHQPKQIIFDSHGDGYLIEDVITNKLKNCGINLDPNGIVRYVN